MQILLRVQNSALILMQMRVLEIVEIMAQLKFCVLLGILFLFSSYYFETVIIYFSNVLCGMLQCQDGVYQNVYSGGNLRTVTFSNGQVCRLVHTFDFADNCSIWL